ncbi:unnamed protein product [Arctogadus glacialis]
MELEGFQLSRRRRTSSLVHKAQRVSTMQLWWCKVEVHSGSEVEVQSVVVARAALTRHPEEKNNSLMTLNN